MCTLLLSRLLPAVRLIYVTEINWPRKLWNEARKQSRKVSIRWHSSLKIWWEVILTNNFFWTYQNQLRLESNLTTEMTWILITAWNTVTKMSFCRNKLKHCWKTTRWQEIWITLVIQVRITSKYLFSHLMLYITQRNFLLTFENFQICCLFGSLFALGFPLFGISC